MPQRAPSPTSVERSSPVARSACLPYDGSHNCSAANPGAQVCGKERSTQRERRRRRRIRVSDGPSLGASACRSDGTRPALNSACTQGNHLHKHSPLAAQPAARRQASPHKRSSSHPPCGGRRRDAQARRRLAAPGGIRRSEVPDGGRLLMRLASTYLTGTPIFRQANLRGQFVSDFSLRRRVARRLLTGKLEGS